MFGVYPIGLVRTGAEALQQLGEFHHLVVLDIGLPDISGLEILRQMKTNPVTRDIAVILITGTSGLEMKIEGFQTGANAGDASKLNAAFQQIRNHILRLSQ